MLKTIYVRLFEKCKCGRRFTRVIVSGQITYNEYADLCDRCSSDLFMNKTNEVYKRVFENDI